MNRYLLLLAFSLVTFTYCTQAQDKLITGRVTDATSQQPLPGVTVLVKGTTIGTTTDPLGKYTILVPASKNTLVFNFIGYTTLERPIDKNTTIDVAMAVDAAQLSEVVVIGYGTAPRRLMGKVSGIIRSNMAVQTSAPVFQDPYYTKPHNTEDYDYIKENTFLDTRKNPLSTFSIDVDAASYSNVRRFLNNGQAPPKDAVRIEEMINYFDYDYPQPTGTDPVAVVSETSVCSWNPANRLLHLGLQGKSIATDNLPASNLVFLVDVSGSMATPDKLPLVKAGFKLLVGQLRPQDQVAIVVYAGSAGLVLPSTPGNQKNKIITAIDNLEAGGSTAGGEGILLAYKTAQEHFKKEGNNRVILATDGDFNVGVSSDGELERLIEEKRETGVFLTVLGFGTGNYKDNKMEKLANKGNGNYAYVDNILEAKKVFVNEFGGTLFTIAKDVKLQLEFNPAQVKAYRLIGYENRALRNEDFNNDKKDAGDLGSGHTVTALYEIVLAGNQSTTYKPDGVDDLKYQTSQINQNALNSKEMLTLKLRYKEPGGIKSKLLQKVITDQTTELSATSDNFRFAAAVAQFGLLLRNSEFKGQASYQQVLDLANNARGKDAAGYRIEFINLVKTSQLLGANSQEPSTKNK